MSDAPRKPRPHNGPKQPKSMSNGNGPSPLVGVRLPPEVHAKLLKYADDRGHPTISAAARDIIEIWLAGD